MAIYEYYCPTCRERFEQRRPMSEATAAVTCREGHRAERTISSFATVATSRGNPATALAEAPPMTGGCGGGGCACACAN